jgi:ABC-2 type transport system permease protein
MGFLIASLVKTHMQLSVTTPIILTSFAMLGGCMWPLEIVNSKILIYLSYITPHRWALEGLEGLVSKSWSVTEIFAPAGVLLVMGVCFIGIGIIFLNKAGDLVTSK